MTTKNKNNMNKIVRKEQFSEKVYLVKGLHSTWTEMINGMPTPVLLKATLLPWKDVIISDGLVTLTPVYFGKGYSSEFKEIYLFRAK